MKGLSFSQIAAALSDLGHKFSRNATIGRAKRLHLPPRERAGNKTARPKKKPTFVFGRGLAKVSAQKPAVDVKPTPSTVGPHLGLQVIELEAAHCRYPQGEGAEITFCGQPIVREDSSYCAAHDDLCHVRSRA